jgi:hypothetical protein
VAARSAGIEIGDHRWGLLASGHYNQKKVLVFLFDGDAESPRYVVKMTRHPDYNGRLELVVSLQEGGQNVMMSFPEQADAGANAFRLAFKYFRRVEGTFRVNPKARVDSVQVRIYETGSSQPRATHTVAL